LVSDDELAAIASQKKPREACQQLVDLAKSRGGPDNITLQIVRIDGAAGPKRTIALNVPAV